MQWACNVVLVNCLNNGSNIIKPWAKAHGFIIFEPLFKIISCNNTTAPAETNDVPRCIPWYSMLCDCGFRSCFSMSWRLDSASFLLRRLFFDFLFEPWQDHERFQAWFKQWKCFQLCESLQRSDGQIDDKGWQGENWSKVKRFKSVRHAQLKAYRFLGGCYIWLLYNCSTFVFQRQYNVIHL